MKRIPKLVAHVAHDVLEGCRLGLRCFPVLLRRQPALLGIELHAMGECGDT